MAHKGKLFPVLFRRDISLGPNYRARLPETYLLKGFAGTGTLAPYINGRTFELTAEDIFLDPYGIMIYGHGSAITPTYQLTILYDYRLTRDKKMAKHAFEIGTTGNWSMRMDFQDLPQSWPYVPFVPPLTIFGSPQFTPTVYGHIEPKPW